MVQAEIVRVPHRGLDVLRTSMLSPVKKKKWIAHPYVGFGS